MGESEEAGSAELDRCTLARQGFQCQTGEEPDRAYTLPMSLRAHVNRRAIVAASVGFASIVAVAACTNRVDSTQDVPVKTTAEQVRPARQGPVKVVVEAALERGELTKEQHAALIAIRDRVEVERRDRRATKERLRASASDIVRSGTADSEQFEGAVDEALDAIEQRMRITSKALHEVHELLQKEQRSAVASALRSRIAERFERRAKRAEKRNRFKKVVGYLMLTDVQVAGLKKVREEVLGDRKDLRPSREELEALVDAFEGDDFGAAMESFQTAKLRLMRGRVAHLAAHADTALSLLTDEQRDLLAELIEVGPEAAGLKNR
jgi:Spy/CpxP family protein refolding chaperone